MSSSSSSNSAVVTSFTVAPFDTTQMTAANVGSMTYNPQTGLMEQIVAISDIGTNPISNSRLVVSGLSNFAGVSLFGAVGTNNGNPFVQYNGPLAPGQNVNLTLDFVVPGRTSIAIPTNDYAAVPVTVTNATLPTGTGVPIAQILIMKSRAILLGFSATAGKHYTIIYADNASMTNAMAVQPPITAGASYVQWLDEGPPATVSAPTNSTARFYQVLQTP